MSSVDLVQPLSFVTPDQEGNDSDGFEEKMPWDDDGHNAHNAFGRMGGNNIEMCMERPCDNPLAGMTGDNIEYYMTKPDDLEESRGVKRPKHSDGRTIYPEQEDELESMLTEKTFQSMIGGMTERAFDSSDNCSIVDACFHNFFHERPTTKEQASHINKTEPVDTWELLVWLADYIETSGFDPKVAQVDMLEIVEGLLDVKW
jgi:hypothetical protein